MIAGLRHWLTQRHIARRVASLTDEQRRAIVEASPYDAGAFQGEGYHVFRKGIADLAEAYVTSLGEVDGRTAEDWITARHFEEEDARRSG
jgi:hypothetical protein